MLLVICISTEAFSQNAKGSIGGTVVDSIKAALQGAQVKLEPSKRVIASDGQGQFLITDLTPGTYSVEVRFVGFKPYDASVTVVAGQVAHIDAVMQVGSQNQEVEVYADRLHGEAEEINRERTSPNILNVLTSDVIKSLPNANIADALGRLPGVTLERDEGEGKYVQIRGTEPRLSNTTIDGINVPSPESGVRQVKLDTIPSDLVESVEINKTLSANQDGDAIGGSVNLVTKTAGETPTVDVYMSQGFTPIVGTQHVSEYGITGGRRFLGSKKLGIIGGFTYDYNSRGIDDIEPVPDSGSLVPNYTSIDQREYRYNRTRWGTAFSADYKLNEGSNLYAKFFYSDFKDYGDRWVYTLNATGLDSKNNLDADGNPTAVDSGTLPAYNAETRLPDYGIGTLAIGGKHLFTSSFLNWEISVARSRQLAAAGDPQANFTYDANGTYNITDPTKPIDQLAAFAFNNCAYNAGQSPSKYRPVWNRACTAPDSPVYTPSNYTLTELDTTGGQTTQINLQGGGDYAINYHAGSHFSTFQFGGKFRNQHKGQLTVAPALTGSGPTMDQLLSDVHNPSYYGGTFQNGPYGSYEKVVAYVKANPDVLTADPVKTVLTEAGQSFNLQEKISAGYGMNTIEFGKFNLQAGLRFEGTNVSTTGYTNPTDSAGNPILDANGSPVINKTPGSGSYIDPLPSVQLRYSLTPETAIRAVYGRGMARPDPQDLIPTVTLDTSTNPATYSFGNPALKTEHSNNYDLLYEQYLKPLGLIQAGFFYKDISSPIISQRLNGTGQYAGFFVQQPVNAGSAYVTGVEIAYQQQLNYLPGLLGGLGFSGNYSYTASKAYKVNPLRSDSPALLRQAPNTWNLSPTYDRGPVSIRLGLSYNGANIYQYQYQNLQYVQTTDANGNTVDTTQTEPLNPPPVGGIKGPGGDNYLYAHLQTDAQINYRLPKGFTAYVSGLNLNNEVFGFYNGSSQYVVQREYYKPTYSFGIRWDLNKER